MEGGGYNVRESTVLAEPGRSGEGQQGSSDFPILQGLLSEEETSGSPCLFETLGQDQFSGGLHYHTGHRPGNSVLQRGWQRRA